MTASVLLVGCGPKAEVSTPSANTAPKDPFSMRASPEVTDQTNGPAKISTDDHGNMLYIIDRNNRIGIDLDGVATIDNDRTEVIDRNVTGQIKESIRDTKLADLEKLPKEQRDCNPDSYSIIVPSLGGDEYQSCDYNLEISDPLFHVSELILGEYSRE